MQTSTANGQPSNGAMGGKRTERQLIRGSRRRQHSSRDVERLARRLPRLARRLRAPLLRRCRRPPAPMEAASAQSKASQERVPTRTSPSRAPVECAVVDSEAASAPLRSTGSSPRTSMWLRAPLRCRHPLRCWHPLLCPRGSLSPEQLRLPWESES